MNKVYKTVWNALRHCLVVVSEATKSASQRGSTSYANGSEVGVSSPMKSVGFKHSKLALNIVACFFSLLSVNSLAADWYPWATDEWMVPSSANSTYDNFYWTYNSGAASPSFILGGAHHSSVNVGTMNILGDFVMTYGPASYLLAEGNFRSYAKGTLNIGGDAHIENGATLTGTGPIQSPTLEAVLNVNGTVYLKNGGKLSGGSSKGSTSTVNFDINQLMIGDKSTFITGNGPSGTFTFTGNFNNITVQSGGTFTAHNGSKGLKSTVVINNSLNLNSGSNLINYSGLVVGSNRDNYVIVGNTVTFDHATVTENMKLAQEQGTINLTGSGYVFADFSQTGGVFNNNGDVTFNGASLDAGQFINTGSISFNGTSVVNKIIEGTGAVNIIGGNFATDHFESGTVNILNGVATLNSLNEGVRHTMSGGELHTGINEIFGSLGVMGNGELNVISLGATMPEDIRTTMTEFFKKYVPGFVKENLGQYVSITGGKVVVNGTGLTETQRDDLTSAFKETFGDATQIVFEGNISGVSKNDVLNVAKVNELYEKAGLQDVIYVDRALEGEGTDVVIGNDGVKNSTGFTSVNDAKSITVKDAKNLVLIGNKENMDMTGGKAITAQGEGSKVTLGTLGLAEGADYSGTLAQIILKGGAGLDVVNGTYNVDELEARESTKSNINIAKTGKLTGKGLRLYDGSTFVNSGTAEFSGSLQGTLSARFTNEIGATATIKGDSTFSGNFANYGKMTMGDLDMTGSFTNGEGATIDMNTLVLAGDLNNYGNLNALDDSFLNGTLLNTGVIKLYNTTVEEGRGDINNTHTIDAKGTITMNGLLSNVDNADLEAIVVSGEKARVYNISGNLTASDKEGTDATGLIEVSDGGEIYNTGNIVADKVVVGAGGYMVNGVMAAEAQTGTLATLGLYRAPRQQATESLRDLEVNEGGQKTNAGIGYYAQGTIAGIFTNAQGAQSFGGISSTWPDGQGLTITSTGQIQNGGTFTMGGSLNNQGSITGDGELVLKRESAAQNVFTNSGTINVGTLTADNITFEHTGGDVQAENGWFTNSTINVKGGAMSHADLGTGNTYNVGTGSSSSVSTLTTDRLTSDSIVNINEGGLFEAKEIALTEDEKTTHLLGGTLKTTLNQIFNDVYYTALDIDAQDPDDIVNIEGIKVATGVSDIIDSVSKGIEFGWGTVAFDDASYSVGMANDVLAKLDANDTDPTGHEGQLEVTFNGDAAEHFNVDMANQVKAVDQEGGTTFATFSREMLTNEASGSVATGLLMAGTDYDQAILKDANRLTTSIGFKGIEGVTGGTEVADGKHLVLVGENQSVNGAKDFAILDGDLMIHGNTADGVESMVTLGSYGTTEMTTGTLKDIYVAVNPSDKDGSYGKGMLRVRHGDFYANNVYVGGTMYVGGNGENGLREDHDATFNATQLVLNSEGKITNWGTLNATTLASGAGSYGGVLNNYNVMNVETGSISGELHNFGQYTGGTLTLTIGADPTSLAWARPTVNEETGVMELDTLNVNAPAEYATGASAAGGMQNLGVLTVNNDMTVGGAFQNDKTATIAHLTLDGLGQFVNSVTGEATIDYLTTTGGKLDNAGTITFAQTQGASSLGSVLNNSGTMNIAEGANAFAVATGGKLTNNKLIDAKGTISVEGGTFTNAGTANLTGLNVTAGQVIAEEGSTFKDSGTTTINMTNAEDVAIDNNTTLELADLDLTQGTIEGGTLNVADGQVASGGILKDIVNFMGNIFSSGSIKNDVATTITGTVTNAGTADYTDVTVVAGGKLDNQATMNADNVTVNTDGTLASSGATELGSLTAQAGGVIEVSNGTLHTGNLVADGAIYNQTGGTISSDKGWFVNSTLNISGGTLNANNIKDAEGNTTGLLGHNTVNISGKNPMPTINNDDPSAVKMPWKDGLTVVTADVVTSDTTINIYEGGVLDVEDLQLTAPGTITMQGGGLQTSLGDFFDYVKTEAIKIDAEDPETGVVEIPTEVLVSTTVGDVQDSIASGINMESGMVAFDDALISQSTIVSAGIQFGEAFADSDVTLHFLGDLESDFTIDTAEELIAEGLSQVLHGIVLDTTTLHNVSEANGDTNKNLVLGGSAEGANSIGAGTDAFKGIGFKDIANAENVLIQSGQELALVGTVRPDDFDWTTGYDDSNKLLIDAADGGQVNIENGIFTMGSDGVRNPTVGWINSSDISADGQLVVKNGEFADWTITNAGTVTVKDNGILHTNTFTNNGQLNIGGGMTIGTLDNANGTVTNVGNLHLTATTDLNGTINNGGTLTADGAVTVSGTYVSDSDSQNNFEDLTITSSMTNGGALTIAGEEGVNDDEFKLTIADGATLTSTGTITNTSHDTLVEGVLTNNGTANYDDMTIAEGGQSINTVYEKGDILTIAQGATHQNSGTSIWNNMTVEGSATNTGKNDIDGTFDINGDYTNKGEIDATGTPTTNVEGDLTNETEGKANYDDMTIANGGTSTNAGYEKGDILTVEEGATHTNSGTSIWNNMQVAGSAENSGKADIDGTFDINGDYTNKGDLDATDTETTNVAGDLVNDKDGTAHYDDMDIAQNGTSTNNGYEEGNILDIGGDWTNNGESHWNNIVVGEGGETHFGEDSTTTTDKITVDGGDLIADGGNFVAGEAELNNGTFVVGNHKELGEDNKVDFTISGETTINTDTWVIGNGNLALGSTTDFDSIIGMPDLPEHPSRVTVGSTVTVGDTGSLAVGTGVWTDKDNHLDIANGDLYFATDSTTIIDAGSLGQTNPAFQATLDTSKVTVEDGATLILGNIKVNGEYKITEGFATAGNTDGTNWIGGWTQDNLYALPQDGSGLGWILDMFYDEDSIWVSAVLENVENVYPDIVLPDNINDNNKHPEYEGTDVDWIDSVLQDQNHGVADKTQVINSVAQIGLASGSMALALNDLTTATNAVENRVSMIGEAFTNEGVMLRDYRKGHALWMDVLASSQEADSYSASGNMDMGFDADSYGFIMGYDHLLENHNVIIGGAFSYQKGDANSTGDSLKTTNDYKTWGLHAYAAWSPSSVINVIGNVSYMRSSSEAEQNLPFGNAQKATADMDTDMFTAGVRAESNLKVAEGVRVVPHAGMRVIHMDQGSFTTKLDKADGFDNKTDATTLVQFPIGVAVRMDKQLENGWNIRPSADLTIIPQAGDTDQRIKVEGSHGVTDTVNGDYAGNFNTQMTLGVQADKGPATFGARYGLGVGGDGKQDHQFKVEFRYQF